MKRLFIIETSPTVDDPVMLNPVSEIKEYGALGAGYVRYTGFDQLDSAIAEAKESVKRIAQEAQDHQHQLDAMAGEGNPHHD